MARLSRHCKKLYEKLVEEVHERGLDCIYDCIDLAVEVVDCKWVLERGEKGIVLVLEKIVLTCLETKTC